MELQKSPSKTPPKGRYLVVIWQAIPDNKKPAMPGNMRAFGRYRMISDGYMWCLEPGSNRYAVFRWRRILSPLCLPISPSRLARSNSSNNKAILHAGGDSTRLIGRLVCHIRLLMHAGARSCSMAMPISKTASRPRKKQAVGSACLNRAVISFLRRLQRGLA